MPSNRINHFIACLGIGLLAICSGKAQSDSLHLSVQALFDLGVENNLQLAASRLKEQMATERLNTARMALYPDIEVGLKGGVLGQPVVFQNGLSNPTRPDTPDWQQNYAIDFSQPLYQGGRIKYAIRQADLEKEIASLQTHVSKADLKLVLLEQYLNLFSLYKQCKVLNRNIEESERRLKDIRQMKEEGLITNNDVLRSEMQLTNNRLSLTETQNNIRLVSQRLDILLGQNENLIIFPDTTLLEQVYTTSGYDTYLQQAFSADPSMLLLQKQTELAENNVRLIRAEQRPKYRLQHPTLWPAPYRVRWLICITTTGTSGSH